MIRRSIIFILIPSFVFIFSCSINRIKPPVDDSGYLTAIFDFISTSGQEVSLKLEEIEFEGMLSGKQSIEFKKEISIGAKLTYAMLLKYARELDRCFPGQERLAKDMGNGKRSVIRYITELEEVGLVSIKRRGQGRPNIYTVHIKASFWKKHR